MTENNLSYYLKQLPPINYHIFHFSGHGVAVVGRPTRIMFDESPYIVWDGRSIRQYRSTKWHDCMVLSDMRLVSLQRVRYFWMVNGIEPVIFSPCPIGESSTEIKIPGRNTIHGLASYCRMKILTKNISIRNFVTEANLLIEKMGLDQIGEVICRKDLLDCKLVDPEYKLKPFYVYLVDMCRLYGNKEDYIDDNDILAP